MNPDRIFDALASSPRRQMLRELSQAERTTSELAAHFALSAPAVSRHLSVLENAGLVASRRDGQRVLYGLVRDTLMGALARITPNPGAGARRVRRDEVARMSKGGQNVLVDLEELEDEELERIQASYRKIAEQAREELRRGVPDTGVPEVRHEVQELRR